MIFSLALFSCALSTEDNPATVVCLTFDDGHASVYEYGLPVLTKYGFSATSFINSGLVDNPTNMCWAQIISLASEHHWEIGSHSFSHANLAQLGYEEARQEILRDKKALINHGITPRSFALSYGICPIDYYDLILAEYDYIRGSSDFPMHNPVDPSNLGYLPFQSGWDADVIKARIMRGVANREAVIIIGFHRIETEGQGYYDNCPRDELEKICQWLQRSGLEVMTISEAMARE